MTCELMLKHSSDFSAKTKLLRHTDRNGKKKPNPAHVTEIQIYSMI